ISGVHSRGRCHRRFRPSTSGQAEGMEGAHRLAGMSSAESEDRFRRIFLAHLEADGYSAAEAYQLIFKTPPPFHHAPTHDTGTRLFEAFQESYQRQLPYGWFFEGLNHRPAADPRWLQPPERPVTLVVIPGIFGEFIEQIPFQSIVDNETSIFRQRWQGA